MSLTFNPVLCQVRQANTGRVDEQNDERGFTFTFGEDSMLSSAEAVISLGPMRNDERVQERKTANTG